MPREKIYKNAAERQAAYRQRNAHRQPTPQGELAEFARNIAANVQYAAMSGDPLAQQLRGNTKAETLRNISLFFKRKIEEEKPATKKRA
jgi:hypothetical protein